MVDAFVRSRNRRALERLRSNRMTLVDSFRSLQGLDLRKTVAGLKDEVAMIEAGIDYLHGLQERSERGFGPVLKR